MESKHPPTKIGIVGCGKISSIYFEAGAKFDGIEIIACADLNMDAARASAATYHIPHVLSVEDLLAHPEVEIVVNLTVPAAHGAVGMAALRAGKSVYNEKPLAISRADAQAMLQLAAERKLRVGCEIGRAHV